MDLGFQNKSFWTSLHFRNGLQDWDMAMQLKLPITTEDVLQEPSVQPYLWIWVNPSLVCPIHGSPGVDLNRSDSPVASVAGATETSSLNTSCDYTNLDCSEKEVLSYPSEAGKVKGNCSAYRGQSYSMHGDLSSLGDAGNSRT